MTKDAPQRMDELLHKLLEGAPAAGLSPQEVDTLREIITAFQGWKLLGRALKWLLWVLGAIAAAAVAWDTIIAHVRGWLQP